MEEVISWYIEDSGYHDARKELPWGIALGAFRGAIVSQGIAARYATQQATNCLAKNYSKMIGPYADWAYSLIPRKHASKL